MQLKSNVSFDDTSVAFKYKSNRALKKANLLFSVINNPVISFLGSSFVKIGLKLRLPLDFLIKPTVFEHFCGGEAIEECKETIEVLAKYHVGTILDYSVEGEHNEAGFDRTMEETMRNIDTAKGHDHIPFCVFKMTGLASRTLLEKVQSGEELDPSERSAFTKVEKRVEMICQKAFDHQIPILIDAEESWIQEPIDKIAYAMMMKYNQEQPIVYNTYQMYRTNMLGNLREAFHYAAMNNYHLGAKLVRGAYMEKERERAEEMNYPSPIQPNKAATDDQYDKALAFCVDNKQRISVINGSHNEYSNYYLALLMEKHGMKNNDKRVWFAQLYGMSENISFNLAKAGYNVAKYVPYGPVKAVMPYLFRRAEENTSVAGQSSRELSLIRKELKRRKLA